MMNFLMPVFAQDDAAAAAAAAGAMVFVAIYLVLIVAAIAGLWVTFTKAGKPGWGVLIPIYNIVLLLEIAGKPVWWLLLFFVPCVNLVITILVSLDVAKNFGKGPGFGIGLWLLPFIFYPMLGFGDAKYQPQAQLD